MGFLFEDKLGLDTPVDDTLVENILAEDKRVVDKLAEGE
jgi:hypothetical protein